MIINLVPVGEPYGHPFEAPLQLVRNGDTLTINGHVCDFSNVPKGATVPDGHAATGGCHYVPPTHPIERDYGGVLHVWVRLPHTADAPDEACFPQPIINPPDGPVALPQTNWPPAVQEQGGDDASN